MYYKPLKIASYLKGRQRSLQGKLFNNSIFKCKYEGQVAFLLRLRFQNRPLLPIEMSL